MSQKNIKWVHWNAKPALVTFTRVPRISTNKRRRIEDRVHLVIVGNQEATEPDCARTTRQDRVTASGVITAGSAMKDKKEGVMVGMTKDAVEEDPDRTSQDEVVEAKECLTAKSPPWF